MVHDDFACLVEEEVRVEKCLGPGSGSWSDDAVGVGRQPEVWGGAVLVEPGGTCRDAQMVGRHF